MSPDILQLSRKQGREMATANWSRKDVESFLQLMKFPEGASIELFAAYLETTNQAA